MRDGGWSTKSAVEEIIELENRLAHFQLTRCDRNESKEVHVQMNYCHMGWDEPGDT